MPCRRSRNGTPVQVFADRVSNERGPIAAGDGGIQFLAEFVIERDGDADGHVADTINASAKYRIAGPIGVSPERGDADGSVAR